jgi:ABC-type spermidine/putrescine transport system permease subunit I
MGAKSLTALRLGRSWYDFRRHKNWSAVLLVLPTSIFFGVLFFIPLGNLASLSFDSHQAGQIGTGDEFVFTFRNYTELASFAYVRYFKITFQLSALAAALSVVIGYPIAYIAARSGGAIRKTLLITLISLLFLNLIVRLYAIQLSFVSVKPLQGAFELLGVPTYGSTLASILVVAGLLHVTLPIVALILVGTIQNVDSQLEDVAQVLGASRIGAIIGITVRLSTRGIVAGFILAFTVSASAFVVPLVLGRGVVVFVSNLVYTRFSVIADYPGGAAISILLLVITIALIVITVRITTPKWEILK